ncbi:hypothetical protein NQ315_003674 [Exocentrus adspersus]|uniref:Transposase n=1 Tax=Exocentrus adspersus TaxID=1586481 RepID=A0AAV8V9U5_9CUCU|nr:hypothetical protein NQ315_003674 [Exocentrus adspersus]
MNNSYPFIGVGDVILQLAGSLGEPSSQHTLNEIEPSSSLGQSSFGHTPNESNDTPQRMLQTPSRELCEQDVPSTSSESYIDGSQARPDHRKRAQLPKQGQKPRRILKDIGVTSSKLLTPRKKILYGEVKALQTKLRRNVIAKKNFRRRLFESERFSDIAVDLSRLHKAAQIFFQLQLREAGKLPKQHRFTQKEKILCLALYKKSPKMYKFLSIMFVLPSKATLNKLLNVITFEPGINEHVFRTLEKTGRNMSQPEKYVSIIFDEMAITPALSFNEKKGYIEGFQDLGGEERSSDFADHVIVFMVRGIMKNFKQPIFYGFTKDGGAKWPQIKQILTVVIKKVIEAGFIPITTICDQAPNNCKALKELFEETKRIFIYHSEIKTAKWEHIQRLYECDSGPGAPGEFRTLNHLTDEHIYAGKMRKMKVKFAAQIFSSRLASTLRLVSAVGQNEILGPGNPLDTAQLLLFVDKMFDSVNGSTKNPRKGKVFRCGISQESPHVSFWKEEALPMLHSMEYAQRGSRDHKKPPSLVNWEFTLRNIIRIWEELNVNGFDYVLGKRLNQDPLENYFGQIRTHGGRYTNPCADAFVGAYKSLLVNNLITKHSDNFNCEEDQCENILQDLKNFLTDSTEMSPPPELEITDVSGGSSSVTSTATYTTSRATASGQTLSNMANQYVAGFVLKKIKSKVHNCKCCNENLYSSENDVANRLILEREYGGAWAKRLCYPSTHIMVSKIPQELIELTFLDPSLQALLVLPLLFSPVTLRKNSKKNWRPTRTEIQESFFIICEDQSSILEVVQRRKLKLDDYQIPPSTLCSWSWHH